MFLEEHLPSTYYPDTLIVHDPSNVSSGKFRVDSTVIMSHPFLYRRLYPQSEKVGSGSKAFPNIAHLHLSPEHRVGVGHHSVVYCAPLQLPSGLTTYKSSSARPGTVKVVAKVAFPERRPRSLLRNEGTVYDSFPQHMSEEYCGWHLLSPFMHSPAPSTAIVPKFFGYYVPIDPPNAPKGKIWLKRSPILLMEDCGSPIVAGNLDADGRAECYSLLLRLHFANYLHNSFHERNIVIQPGPLTRRPIERSMKTPSFRVIDFGRSLTFEAHLASMTFDVLLAQVRLAKKWGEEEQSKEEKDKEIREIAWLRYEREMGDEMSQARSELGFDQVEAI